MKQALECHDFYQSQIRDCDVEIEAKLTQLADEASVASSEDLPPPRTSHPAKDNEPRFDPRALLYRLTGADLTRIDGIGPYSAMRLVSEIGSDMTRWPTVDHFTSWATLAPRNKITGGKVISSKTQTSANRVAYILRNCSRSLIRTQTALGAFYRRLAARIGPPKALTATARKLAQHVCRAIRYGIQYVDPGVAAYDCFLGATASLAVGAPCSTSRGS